MRSVAEKGDNVSDKTKVMYEENDRGADLSDDADGRIATSPDESFRIIAPADPAVTVQPTVSWTAFPDGRWYELIVAGGPGCRPAVQKYSNVAATWRRLDQLLVGGPYYVCLVVTKRDGGRVAAFNSGTFRFSVVN